VQHLQRGEPCETCRQTRQLVPTEVQPHGLNWFQIAPPHPDLAHECAVLRHCARVCVRVTRLIGISMWDIDMGHRYGISDINGISIWISIWDMGYRYGISCHSGVRQYVIITSHHCAQCAIFAFDHCARCASYIGQLPTGVRNFCVIGSLRQSAFASRRARFYLLLLGGQLPPVPPLPPPPAPLLPGLLGGPLLPPPPSSLVPGLLRGGLLLPPLPRPPSRAMHRYTSPLTCTATRNLSLGLQLVTSHSGIAMTPLPSPVPRHATPLT